MKTFEHIDAKTVNEAVSALGAKAKIIAGGTDLLYTLKDEILPDYPETVVNIKTIPNMDYVKEEGDMLKIGALALLADIANNTTVKSKYTALAEAAGRVASPNIREMGTIGGNLCQLARCWYYRNPNNRFFCFRKGGPLCLAVAGENRYHAILGGAVCFAVCPSDTAIALTALDATVVTNKRSIAIGDFYEVLGNTLDNNEIVTEVQVPTPASGTKQTFTKFALRKSIDFAIVSVASAITIEAGKVSDARIVLGAVAPVPYRATGAEAAIAGKAINEANAEAAGTAAVSGNIALEANKYKVQIAKTLVKRAILA